MEINVKFQDNVYLKVECEDSIAQEISDYFSFKIDKAHFHPAVKMRLWDGIIRLFNIKTKNLYVGLRYKLKEFAKSRGYEYNEDAKFLADPFSVTEAQDFVKSINLKLEPRDYQLNTFINAIRYKRRLFLSPTNCHAKGDKVLMYDGIYKNIEDIKIGEYVIGADSNRKKVLNIFNGISKLYDIIPSKNKEKITVTGEHLLPLRISNDGKKYGYSKGDDKKIHFISVNEFITKSKFYKHCSKLVYNENEVKFNSNEVTVNLSPYFIGLYLGDGSSYRCCVTTKDIEILNEVLIQAKNNNCKVLSKDELHYNIVGCTNGRNNIFNQFSKLGLWFSGKNRIKCENRFVPKELLTNSIEYRLQLLAGLIDSDGYLANSTYYEFCSKSKQLADDVYFLSISVGLIPTKSIKVINGTSYYRINICGNIHKIPVRIPRKKLVNVNRHRNSYNSNFNIAERSENEYYGIQVEDSLYITNGGMITHNSGKSLCIYLIVKYLNKKTLIIVPRTSLVEQMTTDFTEYNSSIQDDIQPIYSGAGIPKSSKRIVISTWQSVYKKPLNWFEQFDLIIGDEAHNFKANCLKGILEKTPKCEYKFGFTGTLDGVEINALVLEGLFGKIDQVTTNKELIDRKISSNLTIKSIILNYPDKWRFQIKGLAYDIERDFVIQHKARNNFIANLAHSLDGNVMILYRYIEKHGDILYELLKSKDKDRSGIYYIHGEVDNKFKNEVRTIVDSQKRAILLASIGTFSEGVNIKNINHIIFAHPSKGRIKILQSIGRGLRRTEDKTDITLFDIVDNLSWKRHKNFLLKHYQERTKIYKNEQFTYKEYEVKINE